MQHLPSVGRTDHPNTRGPVGHPHGPYGADRFRWIHPADRRTWRRKGLQQVRVSFRRLQLSGRQCDPRGEEALAYVRERHQLPHGDLDRAERQRVVLQAILAKGLAKETVSNPFKFVNFARGVARHVSVDDRLTERELRKTALSLRMSPSDVHMLQAPISRFGRSPTKQSIDIVDKKQLAELAKALRKDEMDAMSRIIPSDRTRSRARIAGQSSFTSASARRRQRTSGDSQRAT